MEITRKEILGDLQHAQLEKAAAEAKIRYCQQLLTFLDMSPEDVAGVVSAQECVELEIAKAGLAEIKEDVQTFREEIANILKNGDDPLDDTPVNPQGSDASALHDGE